MVSLWVTSVFGAPCKLTFLSRITRSLLVRLLASPYSLNSVQKEKTSRFFPLTTPLKIGGVKSTNRFLLPEELGLRLRESLRSSTASLAAMRAAFSSIHFFSRSLASSAMAVAVASLYRLRTSLNTSSTCVVYIFILSIITSPFLSAVGAAFWTSLRVLTSASTLLESGTVPTVTLLLLISIEPACRSSLAAALSVAIFSWFFTCRMPPFMACSRAARAFSASCLYRPSYSGLSSTTMADMAEVNAFFF